ncbi:MAG: beta-L-arabinofuranosidase domain-containing protein [Candidatus Aminicenantales bacterium]|jgi:hypothetical protein
MKIRPISATLLSAGMLALGCAAALAAPDYPVKDVPLTAVKFVGGFWGARQATDLAVTIGHEIKECEDTNRIRNFELAAAALKGVKDGKFATSYAFDDSDVYKVIEAASYALMLKPDPALEKKLDEWIAKIAAAQEPDGYLYTARTINPAKPLRMSGPKRWVNLRDSHELYNLGHLYEAAVAHNQATGKRNLLAVAVKSADFIRKTFGPAPGQEKRVPGHEEIELGLVKLHRLTGNKDYLDLARFFIEQRGNAAGHALYGEYNQDHKPILEQTEAVGHAVRAAYLYSGVTDVAALTGDKRYLVPLGRIWDDIVSRKLYLTGGIGAAGGIEGFGPAYDLPNATGYAETCATIAYALWNYRMFRASGDGKYMDMFERATLNAFLSGSGMSGDLFFYPNPLASMGQHQRTPWFNCACCPPNVARFIAEMGGFAYGVEADSIYVNLYASGTAAVSLPSGGPIRLEQTTEYPWKGEVKIKIRPEKPGLWTLLLRVPGWAQGRPISSDLYVYAGETKEKPGLKVNGKAAAYELRQGYASITRSWKSGDVVEMLLPMPIRRVLAHPAIKDDIGRVAIERGPLVYCAEWTDNGGGSSNLVLEDKAVLTADFQPSMLGGITTISGTAAALRRSGDVVVAEPRPLVLIPYFAWAHRGKGEMAVWLARDKAKARPTPEPTIASRAKVSASPGLRQPDGVHNLFDPASSNDQSAGWSDWWPKKGTAEWIEYDFGAPVELSETSVYWFDDAGEGECRVPASWKAFSKSGAQWVPVEAAGPYGVEKDRYNTTAFKPVKTAGLRIEIKLQEKFSGGVLEWKVR